MSVVVSGDFFRFRLALPPLLFLSKDEVKAAQSDFDRCSCEGGLRTENPPDWHFSQPYFTILDHCTLGHVSKPKLPAHFAGNERFLPEFPSSLLSGYALNKQTGQGRGRNFGTRLIFSLPRVVRSSNLPKFLPRPCNITCSNF